MNHDLFTWQKQLQIIPTKYGYTKASSLYCVPESAGFSACNITG